MSEKGLRQILGIPTQKPPIVASSGRPAANNDDRAQSRASCAFDFRLQIPTAVPNINSNMLDGSGTVAFSKDPLPAVTPKYSVDFTEAS